MLVYRTCRRPSGTAPLLRSVLDETERLAAGRPGHDRVRDLLVAFDELESAVADALNPETDGEGAVQTAFRRAALEMGRAFAASHEGRAEECREALGRLGLRLHRLRQLELPQTVLTAQAEGYAWYALFPESYLAAARRFWEEERPRSAVCLGIRQIGASLSAVVAAALQRQGCPVRLHTVRPRGHPFHRVFLPSPPFAGRLRARADSVHFLIVDEGPGLSGSSLCSVAETLSNWGIPDERIVFFPSWIPDGSAFASPGARARWRRHRAFCAAPEDLWPGGSPLSGIFPGWEPRDISAGEWRPLLLGSPAAYPPVHPQHERRKILLKPPGLPLPSAPEGWRGISPDAFVLARFAGFGGRGRGALERARLLEEGGWGPPVLGHAEGFLLTRFVPGRPLGPRDASAELVETVARYLAWVRERFPAQDETPPEALAEMIRVNVAEGLGERWAERLPPLEDLAVPAPPSALDARLFPHEWLSTPAGYRKTDGFDHHDDHFFPGPTDIAWDLAAACIEFRLPPAQAARLLRAFQTHSGDAGIACRLPFHRLGWLAFRLGYATLAADGLAPSGEADRFRRALCLYRRLLQIEIENLACPRGDATFTMGMRPAKTSKKG